MKDKGLIKQIKRGVYRISDKPEYHPEISTELYRMASIASNTFDDLQYCVWNVGWLNEFAQHQFSVSFSILEVEKDLAESILFALKDNRFKNTFLTPDQPIIERHIADSEKAIIVSNLISRAPAQAVSYKKREVKIPTLEKILVDVFSDPDTFYFLYGIEKMYIFKAAIKKYSIDFTKLFSYASRRGKQDELREFLHKHLEEVVKDII